MSELSRWAAQTFGSYEGKAQVQDPDWNGILYWFGGRAIAFVRSEENPLGNPPALSPLWLHDDLEFVPLTAQESPSPGIWAVEGKVETVCTEV